MKKHSHEDSENVQIPEAPQQQPQGQAQAQQSQKPAVGQKIRSGGHEYEVTSVEPAMTIKAVLLRDGQRDERRTLTLGSDDYAQAEKV